MFGELLDFRDQFSVVEFPHVNYTTCHPKNTFSLSILITKRKKDIFKMELMDMSGLGRSDLSFT